VLPVITPDEASRLDRGSEVPIDVLMDRAGRAVALAAVRMGMGYGCRVSVLAGPGNNGGDGYVAAHYLRQRGVAVKVFALGDPRTDVARAAAARIRATPMAGPIDSDLVIDALFGGGWRAGIEPEVEKWIEARPRVLSVDIPTGVDPLTGVAVDAAFRAERTVTFGALKSGHLLGDGPDYAGTIEVADIGLPEPRPAMYLTEDIDAPVPARARMAHKWSAGSVLVVGGAPGTIGAALMAARAALHFGAGAVGLAVPESAAAVAGTAAPELLHHRLDDLPDRYRTLVIGPGLGFDHDELARKLIESWRGSVVVDADALRLVAARPQLVITPHAGEISRMGGGEPTAENASALAASLGAVVVLKGTPTVIAGGDLPWLVNSGGPELATIGTGDVLAGMIGALLAQGLEPAVAARSAAYWHGRAGNELAKRETVTAPGLITEIGRLR
jgi:NAD(P)H-hydrate epimerase